MLALPFISHTCGSHPAGRHLEAVGEQIDRVLVRRADERVMPEPAHVQRFVVGPEAHGADRCGHRPSLPSERAPRRSGTQALDRRASTALSNSARNSGEGSNSTAARFPHLLGRDLRALTLRRSQGLRATEGHGSSQFTVHCDLQRGSASRRAAARAAVVCTVDEQPHAVITVASTSSPAAGCVRCAATAASRYTSQPSCSRVGGATACCVAVLFALQLTMLTNHSARRSRTATIVAPRSLVAARSCGRGHR